MGTIKGFITQHKRQHKNHIQETLKPKSNTHTFSQVLDLIPDISILAALNKGKCAKLNARSIEISQPCEFIFSGAKQKCCAKLSAKAMQGGNNRNLNFHKIFHNLRHFTTFSTTQRISQHKAIDNTKH